MARSSRDWFWLATSVSHAHDWFLDAIAKVPTQDLVAQGKAVREAMRAIVFAYDRRNGELERFVQMHADIREALASHPDLPFLVAQEALSTAYRSNEEGLYFYACLDRSAVQILIEDFAVQIDPEILDELDGVLRGISTIDGPVADVYCPPDPPPSHWWWTYEP